MENLLLFNILWRLAYTTAHFAIQILSPFSAQRLHLWSIVDAKADLFLVKQDLASFLDVEEGEKASPGMAIDSVGVRPWTD